MESVSDSLVRNVHTSSLLEVILWGSGSAPPLPPCTKEQILVLLLGWCPSTALSSSPCVTAGLLVSPPCSWDCADRHSKPFATAGMDVSSWRCWIPWATWLGCRYCLMLPVVTRALAEHKTKEESVRKDKERSIFCGHQMQNHSLFGGCLAFGSPLQLLSL